MVNSYSSFLKNEKKKKKKKKTTVSLFQALHYCAGKKIQQCISALEHFAHCQVIVQVHLGMVYIYEG